MPHKFTPREDLLARPIDPQILFGICIGISCIAILFALRYPNKDRNTSSTIFLLIGTLFCVWLYWVAVPGVGISAIMLHVSFTIFLFGTIAWSEPSP